VSRGPGHLQQYVLITMYRTNKPMTFAEVIRIVRHWRAWRSEDCRLRGGPAGRKPAWRWPSLRPSATSWTSWPLCSPLCSGASPAAPFLGLTPRPQRRAGSASSVQIVLRLCALEARRDFGERRLTGSARAKECTCSNLHEALSAYTKKSAGAYSGIIGLYAIAGVFRLSCRISKMHRRWH
jgi:hypothetical protein